MLSTAPGASVTCSSITPLYTSQPRLTNLVSVVGSDFSPSEKARKLPGAHLTFLPEAGHARAHSVLREAITPPSPSPSLSTLLLSPRFSPTAPHNQHNLVLPCPSLSCLVLSLSLPFPLFPSSPLSLRASLLISLVRQHCSPYRVPLLVCLKNVFFMSF